MTNHQPPSIADSPWFWFALFTGVGMTFLLVTGGRFGRRQAGIERKYQAREWMRAQAAREGKNAEDSTETDLAAGGSQRNLELSAPLPNYSTKSKTLIRLGPLEAALGVLSALCLGMFVRERLKQRGEDGQEPPLGGSAS